MELINIKELKQDITSFKSEVEDYFKESNCEGYLETHLIHDGFNLVCKMEKIINEKTDNYTKSLENLVDCLKEDNMNKKTEYTNFLVKINNKLNALLTTYHILHEKSLNSLLLKCQNWLTFSEDVTYILADAIECLQFVDKIKHLVDDELKKNGAK